LITLSSHTPKIGAVATAIACTVQGTRGGPGDRGGGCQQRVADACAGGGGSPHGRSDVRWPYNSTMAEGTVVPGEQIEPAAEDGQCECCGKPGLLARISSRLLSGHATVCDECLDDYRHGNVEVAKAVVARFRPL